MPAPMTTTRAEVGTEAMGGRPSDAGVACYATRCVIRNNASTFANGPAPVKMPTRPPRSGEPGLDRVLVLLDPLGGRVLRGHLVRGDVLRHHVLVLVGPLPLLHHLGGRGARVQELLGGDLLQLGLGVVA